MAEVEIVQVKPKRGRPRGEKRATFKDWYEQNKQALSDKRKERYHTDPEYRNRIIEMNRERRKRLRNESGKTEKTSDGKRPRAPLTLEVEIGGQKQVMTMYFVGHMAESIGRSVQTIHSWEKRGAIPKTPFKNDSSKQERLYTAQMIEVVRELTAHEGIDSDWLYSEILTRWRRLGVVCPD